MLPEHGVKETPATQPPADDPWANYDPAKALAGLRASAGILAGCIVSPCCPVCAHYKAKRTTAAPRTGIHRPSAFATVADISIVVVE
jgi:hypothetical protein